MLPSTTTDSPFGNNRCQICDIHQSPSLHTLGAILWIAGSMLGFYLIFHFGWIHLFERYFPRFDTFSLPVRADIVSRLTSTVHSLVIIPLMFYGLLSIKWGPEFQALESTIVLQRTMCITIGYFLLDTIVMVEYQVPMLGLFLTHHAFATTPYLIYLFCPSCSRIGCFVLSAFLLVETTNVPLNIQNWLEQAGKGGSKAYVVTFYTTIATWIPFRLALPYWLTLTLIWKIWPKIQQETHKWCLIPGTVSSCFIVLFCTAVFTVVFLKEVWLRWKSRPHVEDVADLTPENRSFCVNPDLPPMDEDEMQITYGSPTRVLAYKARERLYEFEEVVEHAVESSCGAHLPHFHHHHHHEHQKHHRLPQEEEARKEEEDDDDDSGRRPVKKDTSCMA